MELDTSTFKRRRNKFPENPDEFLSNFLYVVGNNTLSDVVAYTANLTWVNSSNVESYDVYINGDYFGTDVQKIQITTNDVLMIDVVKTDGTQEASIKFENTLV
jgi:predicted RNA-binding protein